jgi:Cu(I)/Ag(I) efflux system periplasmic protein CusF
MKILTAVIAALVLASPGAWATSHQSHAQAADKAMADGEIRKVDADAQKVTIKHGPLPNLDMPAMTMVFRVKDPAMLDRMKAGAKIRFRAEKVGGAYTVMEVEDVK